MKKKCLCLIFALLLASFSGAMFYKIGYSNGLEQNREDNFLQLEDTPTGYIDKIDYPLIDIAFNDGNDWKVIITYGIYTENPIYMICADGRELQFCKEYLSVTTYPAGRGTTGNGCVTVYKNGQEVKSVEFFECSFEKEELRQKFEKVSKEDALKIIAGEKQTEFVEFTLQKTFSYDKTFYALQSKAEENGIEYIKVSIYKTDDNEEVFSFTPARALDFWGVCWEKSSYNLWVQSGDIGVLCYSYNNGEWNLDISAQKPLYIKSKYD